MPTLNPLFGFRVQYLLKAFMVIALRTYELNNIPKRVKTPILLNRI